MQEVEFVDVDLVADVDALATGSRWVAPLITCSITAPVKMPVWVKNDTPPFSQRGKLTKLPIMPTSVLTMPMVLGPASKSPDGAGDLAQAILVGAALLARLGESGRDDAGRLGAGRDALPDGVFDVLLRQHDVDEVDLLRHFGERRIGVLAHDVARGCG